MHVLLVLASLYIPYRGYKKKSIDYRYFIVLSLFVIIHHIISFIITPQSDMFNFNELASQGVSIDSFRMNNAFNISIVYGWFYKIQNNYLVGNSLGVVGYTIAMIFLSKIMSIMNMSSLKQTWTLILTSIAPASLYYNSSILREPWMLCFFIMFIYFLFTHYIHYKKKYMFYALCSMFLLLTLHFKSAVFYCLLVMLCYLPIYLSQFYRLDLLSKTIIIIILFSVFVVSVSYMITIFGRDHVSNYCFFQDAVRHSIKYQHVVNSVTDYTLITDSKDNMFIIPIKQFVRYWFAPYPWQMFSDGVVSLVLGGIALIRFIMFVCVIKYLVDGCANIVCNKDKTFITILCLTLLFTTIIFSLGTANYGTSNRHWDISWWILCLLFIISRKKMFRISL